MKLSSRTTFTLFAAFVVAAPLFTTSASPARQNERQRTAIQPVSTASPKQQKEASKKAADASRVFEQVMGAPDRSIPKDLLDRAEAVAVFPGMLKAGFVVGGRGGSEASAAAGPVGRTAAASTNLKLDAGILSYSRSKGLFAGLELKGGVINPDNNLNEALYGLKAKEILTGANKVKMADVLPGIIVFPNTLARYSIK